MTRTLRYLLLFVFVGLSGSAFAQEIAGRVLDEKKEPMISAAVQVYQGGILKGGTVTDYDGNYVVKPLDPGDYNVLVLYAGYDSVFVTNVVVSPGKRTTQNFNMQKPQGVKLAGVIITGYKKPLINHDGSTHILTKEEIKVIPTTEVSDLVALAPAQYQSQRGKDVNIGGARSSGTLYIIDGVQVQGTSGINLSQGSVEQLEVISSGISAKYGDVSGGVVNITSRGVSQKLTGNVRLQHSIDGYNNNLVSFSIAGPLYKKRIPGDSLHKKPVLGFSLSGDYYDDHNRYPAYDQQYVVKDDVYRDLIKNPLKITSDNSGNRVYNYASNYITFKDLKQSKIPPHNRTQELRLNGKLDYQLSDNLRIAAGGTADLTRDDQYSRTRSLLAADGTPVRDDINARGYVRFTQKFTKTGDTSSRHSIISNAFYTVQADFQKTNFIIQDPTFKKDIFKYAYIGKFDETRTPIYAANQTDSASGRKGTVLFGSFSNGVTFNRSELNSNLANYTTQYYNSLEGTLPNAITTIQGLALANGDEPKSTYSFNGVGLFTSPGATQTYYQNFNSNQYALSVDASFDLQAGNTRHAIEFGLYYQQRIQKQFVAYANRGSSLWSLMRGLVSNVNNGNLKLDKQNPIFLVNGTKYTLDQVKSGVVIPGPSDTILYNYTNIGNSAFDKNLRSHLGLKSTDNINIDALDPSTFSLSMFSADELLNSGIPFVEYYGYNYDGSAQTGTVNFNDFWTQKDSKGNYTRPIGAFSPNYIAGYILDRFDYKDIHFNVGVRVDRYSANSKVLIDPYSLSPETNVSQNTIASNTYTANGKAPGNMGSGYVVYVNDNKATTPTVVGYRNGNNWYDPYGKFIEDPRTLKQYTGGRDAQPLIQRPYQNINITDSNFNPNLSFTDYSPQVTVMPRLSFSFPVSDVADFHAHYDIYSQRPYPTSLGIATPFDYYYLTQNSNSVIPNANLRSQKTFDYEVGFQQKLTERSALTLTAFYKERKDIINTVPYFNAYPISYFTYGNRDFSTTKGTTLVYDMRATNHLRMNVSYTLSFAEGTGSTPTGGKGLLGSLIEAGLPNIRYVTALDYDSRHNIAANVDYRFGDGEGPVVKGKEHPSECRCRFRYQNKKRRALHKVF